MAVAALYRMSDRPSSGICGALPGSAPDADAVKMKPRMAAVKPTYANRTTASSHHIEVVNCLVVSERVAAAYDEHLFRGRTLQHLPADNEGPRFVINSTNVQTIGWLDVFLVEPSLARQRSNRGDVYVEVVGSTTTGVQLVSKKVPYLIE